MEYHCFAAMEWLRYSERGRGQGEHKKNKTTYKNVRSHFGSSLFSLLITHDWCFEVYTKFVPVSDHQKKNEIHKIQPTYPTSWNLAQLFVYKPVFIRFEEKNLLSAPLASSHNAIWRGCLLFNSNIKLMQKWLWQARGPFPSQHRAQRTIREREPQDSL